MSEYHIVIAERGWVYVGKTRREADQLVIEDCFNIRRWGTTKGIGEIALGGPTENTGGAKVALANCAAREGLELASISDLAELAVS